MIVVDSNIIVYLYVHGDRTDQAYRALHKDPYWIAPPLWESEFRNVMAGYIRRGILPPADAKSVMRAALQTMGGREIFPPSDVVLDLVAASDCSAYDCEYVALARQLNIKLVTCDNQVVRNFPDTAIALDAFCARL